MLDDFQQLKDWIQTKYQGQSFWMEQLGYQKRQRELMLFGWNQTEWYPYDEANPDYEEVRDIMEFIRNCPAFYLRIGEADGDTSIRLFTHPNRSNALLVACLFQQFLTK